jgi:hypothetical protein
VSAGAYYILDEHRIPVPIEDPIRWGKWFQSADRVVRKEYVGPYLVSTVFLGLNHNWTGGPPILFETMVFIDGGSLDEQTRCSTWDQALQMHENMVAKMREKGGRA